MKMIVILGLIFVGSYQPIMMIFSMILLTLFMSYYLYSVVGSFWYSYMLLLIMLSGVLILFTYMVSLLPNERFEIMSMIYIGMMCMIIGIFLLMNFVESNYDGMKMWWGLMWFLNIFMFTFLLIMMIMVVWVTLLEKIPMRIL